MNKVDTYEEEVVKFCKNRHWRCVKILESKNKSPDFKIFKEGEAAPFMIVEVKSIKGNDLDKTIEGAFTGEKFNTWEKSANTAFGAIRNRIKKARDQFVDSQYLNLPQVVFLYSDRISTLYEISESSLREALWGRTFLCLKDNKIVDQIHRGRIFRKGHMTCVSAVIVPKESGGAIIAENQYAEIPILKDLFLNSDDCWLSE